MYYNMIRKYYIEGYGYPKKYYTDVDLDKFVVKGMITQQQSDELKAEKGSDKEGLRLFKRQWSSK